MESVYSVLLKINITAKEVMLKVKRHKELIVTFKLDAPI